MAKHNTYKHGNGVINIRKSKNKMDRLYNWNE